MKVILLADVKKVGRRNEICEVASGYAQNVLLPKNLAVPATPENVKRFKKEEGRAADKKAYNQALVDKNIADVAGKTLTLKVRANENGKLFQAIHTKQIADAIANEFNVHIPEKSIVSMDIKEIGTHSISIGNKNLTLVVENN